LSRSLQRTGRVCCLLVPPPPPPPPPPLHVWVVLVAGHRPARQRSSRLPQTPPTGASARIWRRRWRRSASGWPSASATAASAMGQARRRRRRRRQQAGRARRSPGCRSGGGACTDAASSWCRSTQPRGCGWLPRSSWGCRRWLRAVRGCGASRCTRRWLRRPVLWRPTTRVHRCAGRRSSAGHARRHAPARR
jgi:hypothetical protein